MFLRRELAADRDAVFALHCAAFGRPGGPPASEAALVDRLRAAGDVLPGLSIVAAISGRLVGHVVCSRARMDGEPSIGLGPLAVHPVQQGRGVGQALMHAVLAAADALDAPAVVLLGDPGYYRRFGFEPAEAAGVRAPRPEWRDHLQVRRLTAWSGLGGTFHYAPAFDAL